MLSIDLVSISKSITLSIDPVSIVVALVFGIFGIVSRIWYNANSKKSSILDRKLQLQKIFPFLSYNRTNLNELADHSVGPLTEVPFTSRKSDFNLLELISDNRLLLVTGRSGIGKSREVLEAIYKLDEMEGDPLTVFSPDKYICRPYGVDRLGGMFKRPILFIEDIDDYYTNDKDDAKFNEEIGADSFHDRLVDSVNWFSKQSSRLRVIFTAQDVTFMDTLDKKELAFWNEFRIIMIPEFSRERIVSLIKATSNHLQLTIDDATTTYIQSNCDATAKGIIEGIYRIKAINPKSRVISIGNASTGSFTWPQKWKVSVYEEEIATNSLSKAVFESLALLETLWIKPLTTLVVDLSSRINSNFLYLYQRHKIKQHINKELSQWIRLVDDRVICQDAYIHSLGHNQEHIPKLLKSLSTLPDSEACKLAPSLLTIIKRTYFVTKDATISAEILGALDGKCVDDLGFLEAMYAAHMLSKNYEGAITSAEGIARLTNSSPPSLTKLAWAYAKAVELANTTHRREELLLKAISISSKALDSDPDYLPALRSLSIQNGLLDRHEESINFGQHLAEISGRPKDWYHLGVAYGKNGDYDKSINALNISLSMRHDDVETLNSLVINLSNAGKVEEQITPLEILAKLQPEKTDYHVQLGTVYAKCGKHLESLNTANKALEIDPENVSVKQTLGYALANNGRHQEALLYLPKSTVDKLRNYEKQFGSESLSYDDRISFLEKKLEENDKSFEIWQLIGAMRRKKGEGLSMNGDECLALKIYEHSLSNHIKALELALIHEATPEQLCSIWYAKGRVLLCLDKIDEACDCFRRAHKLNNNHLRAKEFLSSHCETSN